MRIDGLWEGRPDMGRPAQRITDMFEIDGEEDIVYHYDTWAFIEVPGTGYEWRVLYHDDAGPYVLLHSKYELPKRSE